MIRVLIVGDSLPFRAALRAGLESDPDIRVVGRARDGVEAVKLVLRLQPDLITLEVPMPDSDGLQAVEQIMAQRPTPIIVVTSLARETIVFRALTAGALQVVTKPKARSESMAPIIQCVKSLARARPRQARLPAGPPPVPDGKATAGGAGARAVPGPASGPLVVLAASAGGPQALMHVLSGLPAGLPAAVLVVQHIAAGFARGLAHWLNQTCTLPVRLAEADHLAGPGLVLIAPDDAHLVLGRRRRIILDRRTGLSLPVCPAADLTLQSAAPLCGADLLAVVLTGMGRDGAAGVEAVKAHGGQVIVQDQATSAAYGMPQAARPFADAELPLESIAADIIRFVHERRT